MLLLELPLHLLPSLIQSSIRYIVEKTFGLLKLYYDLGKARHLGLERNKTRAHWAHKKTLTKLFLNAIVNFLIIIFTSTRQILKICKNLDNTT
jgi:hypothetical protein